MLLELRQRRQELDARDTTVTARESTLAAAELRLNARVAELETLQHQLEALEQAREQRDDASWLGLVKLYEVETGKEVATLKGHKGDVWSVAFHPSGKLLAAADGDWKEPSAAKLWKLPEGTEAGSLKHTGEVLAIAFSPDGKQVAASSWDRTTRVWKLTGQLAP